MYIQKKKGKSKLVIKANDWISVSPLKFIKRIIGNSSYKILNKDEKTLITNISKNLRLIKDENNDVIGRGLIYKEEYNYKKEERLGFNGVVTVGGMKTSGLSGIIGVLIGKSHRASRDIGIPFVSENVIKKWSTGQAKLLSNLKLDDEIQISCASVIRACGGHTEELNIAYHKTGIVNYKKIKEIISSSKKEQFLIIWESTVETYEKENNYKVELFDNVFAVDGSIPGVLQTRNSEHYVSWPKDNWEWFHSRSLEGIIKEAISECWDIEVPILIELSDISSDEKAYSASIGIANGKDVINDHLDIIKKK
ncbi:hypothetical protein M601_005095 [Cellulophaga baltica 4]|nr:hypothetical protein M601_005095 [Cellulophaga baltica 4]